MVFYVFDTDAYDGGNRDDVDGGDDDDGEASDQQGMGEPSAPKAIVVLGTGTLARRWKKR